MHPGRWFEDTFENPQWRKIKQMQPLWLCILWGRKFEDSSENTQWTKVEQMSDSGIVCFLIFYKEEPKSFHQKCDLVNARMQQAIYSKSTLNACSKLDVNIRHVIIFVERGSVWPFNLSIIIFLNAQYFLENPMLIVKFTNIAISLDCFTP